MLYVFLLIYLKSKNFILTIIIISMGHFKDKLAKFVVFGRDKPKFI